MGSSLFKHFNNFNNNINHMFFFFLLNRLQKTLHVTHTVWFQPTNPQFPADIFNLQPTRTTLATALGSGHYLWVGGDGVLRFRPCTEILSPPQLHVLKFCPPLNSVNSN